MQRRWYIAILLALVCALPSLAQTTPGEEAARQAARAFGQALKKADASQMRPILPQRGKVQLRLVRLGPEEGFFSSGQVEALMRDFLKQGSVRSFDLLRTEQGPSGFGIVEARAMVTDRDGRVARLALHLAFEPEDDRWVLREMRESEP